MAIVHINTEDMYKAGRCMGYATAEFVRGFEDGIAAYAQDLKKVLEEEAAHEKESAPETVTESEAQQ